MKILAISCSPKKEGNTVKLLKHALEGAQQEGAQVELFSVAEKTIKPCQGCGVCRSTGKCMLQDDMEELYEKMIASDGIIFGTPIYVYGMTSQAKTIMERCAPLSTFNKNFNNLNNKVAGVVVTAGSLGIINALKDWYYFIVTRRMLPANHVAAYPVAAYPVDANSGLNKEDSLNKLEKGIQAAHALGHQMVMLANMGFKYPAEFISPSIAYGTHTW